MGVRSFQCVTRGSASVHEEVQNGNGFQPSRLKLTWEQTSLQILYEKNRNRLKLVLLPAGWEGPNPAVSSSQGMALLHCEGWGCLTGALLAAGKSRFYTQLGTAPHKNSGPASLSCHTLKILISVRGRESVTRALLRRYDVQWSTLFWLTWTWPQRQSTPILSMCKPPCSRR